MKVEIEIEQNKANGQWRAYFQHIDPCMGGSVGIGFTAAEAAAKLMLQINWNDVVEEQA